MFLLPIPIYKYVIYKKKFILLAQSKMPLISSVIDVRSGIVLVAVAIPFIIPVAVGALDFGTTEIVAGRLPLSRCLGSS